MKTRLKSTSLIYILSICFIFAFFVNCSGMDTPFKKSPSQIEDDDNNDGNDDDNDDDNDGGNDGGNDDGNDDENDGGNDDDNDENDTGDSGDNDVSDFSWDKVIWLADEHNVSDWEETSQITSVEVTQKGAICVDHTKKDTWPDGNENSWSSNQPLIASFWAIVKLDGQYYAATWELALRGEVCKLGHYDPNGTLNKLYESVWNEHFKSGPLRTSWQPQGGQVVGFMVSGLARHLHHHSIQERSNIQWYRLPSIDGSISGQILGTYSSQ